MCKTLACRILSDEHSLLPLHGGRVHFGTQGSGAHGLLPMHDSPLLLLLLLLSLLLPVLLLQTYGRDAALKWFVYWRLFYLACSELFNYNGGEEWGVGHYLFMKPVAAAASKAA